VQIPHDARGVPNPYVIMINATAQDDGAKRGVMQNKLIDAEKRYVTELNDVIQVPLCHLSLPFIHLLLF